jgi:hypothetical protein
MYGNGFKFNVPLLLSGGVGFPPQAVAIVEAVGYSLVWHLALVAPGSFSGAPDTVGRQRASKSPIAAVCGLLDVGVHTNFSPTSGWLLILFISVASPR